MASLTELLLGTSDKVAPAVDSAEHPLTDSLLTVETPQSRKEKLKAEAPQRINELNAFKQGLRDIINTGASGIGYIDKTLIPGGEKRNEKFQQSLKTENQTFEQTNPPSEGLLPTTAEVARMGGQAVATAPLMPARAFQAVRGVMGALPTVSAAGEKVAAPILNRLGATTVTGAIGGGEFGGLTSSTNDKSLAENVGTGMITGALVAPALSVAGAAGSKVLPVARNMWASLDIGKLARNADMDPAAVKYIVKALDTAGYTPQQAQAELNKLGPSATLADLASSLETTASGLASFGGKPTEILKGRFEARSKTANSNAATIMENKIGPKPDLEAEKEAIVKQAQREVRPDYKKAYSSGQQLDVSDVVTSIDKQLETAVGSKEAALKQIRTYLFNKNGTLKNNIEHLHEVRIGIDDVLNDKNPVTSHGKSALAAVSDIRDAIDTKLKTNPEMLAADTKFAEKMTIKNAIDLGTEVLKKNGMNKQEFAKLFDNSSPEIQDAIKKGIRGHLGDLMEAATRGELSEAQRLFGKSSLNRANLEKAFGQRGIEVLDELQKEATFRNTENKIRHGAQTAERQAVQREFGERNDKGGGAAEILHGAMIDAAMGSPALATGIATIKRVGSHAKLSLSTNAKDRMIEGTSDLISRTGAERDVSLDVFNKVNKIQNRLSSKPSRFKLPTNFTPLLSAPIGESGYSAYKKLGNE